MNMSKIFLALGLALVVALGIGIGGATAARDGRNNDHERARQAFERGEILPITEILAIVAQHLPGDVVEVELNFGRDRIEYEVDVLTATGRVREIDLDGRTGAVLEIDD
jgi:uncharacterized membrane protein YkoI